MLQGDNANGFYIFALGVSANYNLRSGRILRALIGSYTFPLTW